MDDNGAVPNRTATSIAIDPANADIVYVSFGGFSTGNVWKTVNGGLNWTNASGGGAGTLPSAPVRSVIAHPFAPGWIYAGTDVGVFASEDAGATWQVPHDGPANVAVFQLFFMNNLLVAVTHGRGHVHRGCRLRGAHDHAASRQPDDRPGRQHVLLSGRQRLPHADVAVAALERRGLAESRERRDVQRCDDAGTRRHGRRRR